MGSFLTNILFELPSVHVRYMPTGACPDFQHYFLRNTCVWPTYKGEEISSSIWK